MRVKMSKQPLLAPTASAVGPCLTLSKLVGRPGPGSLSRTIAPPVISFSKMTEMHINCSRFRKFGGWSGGAMVLRGGRVVQWC